MQQTTSRWEAIETPAQLKDVRLRMLLAHWTEAAADGRMPTPDIIDPIKLGDLMGWLFVYEVERDPMRFRYLVYGPKIARRIGFDLTGKYVHDHPIAEAREAIARLLTAVATSGRPHRGVSTRRILDRDATTEAVVVPLAGPDGSVRQLLALQTYDVPSEDEAPATASGGSTEKSRWMPVDDPAELRDERLQRMLAHWTEAATGGAPPTQALVDPAKLGDLMDWLFVYQVERDPLRFRYIVHSPKIALRMGADFTGRYVDEIPNAEAREAVGKVLAAVLATARPHRFESTRRFMGHDVATEVVVMPLAGPGGGIDRLLALQVYDVPDAKPKIRPPSEKFTGNWAGKPIHTPIEDGSQLKDIRIRLAYARWLAGIRDGRLPSKDLVDPATFGDLMGWLALYRVERDPRRYLYLIYSEKFALRHNLDMTGRYVDEYPDQKRAEAITAILDMIVDTRRPRHGVSPRWMADRVIVTEAVMMPLEGPDGSIDHVVAVQVLEELDDADAPTREVD
ncbi:MAG: PAS domain-containing protein [Alphaproteobacteria bacterium]|nr:PAS domain-containing protein [Alphaproteobacteria bacterium]